MDFFSLGLYNRKNGVSMSYYLYLYVRKPLLSDMLCLYIYIYIITFSIHMESGYSSSLTLIIFISTGRYPRIFSVFSPLLSLSFTCALIRYESYLRRSPFFSSFFFFSPHSGLRTVKRRAPFRGIYFLLSAGVGMLKLFDGCCDQGQHICVMKTNNRSW